MQFPVHITLNGVPLHPHALFESLAFVTGLLLNHWQHQRLEKHASPPDSSSQPLGVQQRIGLFLGATFGMLLGATSLAWLEQPWVYFAHPQQMLISGKTVVGGILGGWLGVEIAKKLNRVTRSTGDAWVLPLCAGMAIGRIGCFLAGLEDGTFGNHTSLPWAVDFGDGPRHPTQLYDIVLLTLLALVFLLSQRWELPSGVRFRGFILGYCAYRFLVEFIKPPHQPLGIGAIQIACLIACYVSILQIRRDMRRWHSLTKHLTGTAAHA